MLAVDVLMPVTASPYADVAPEYLAPYLPAFANAGMALRPRAWNLGPGESDATLALFAWGYHLDVAGWYEMLAGWPADRVLLNPAGLLAWNTRKTYLRDLEEARIPIVPSIFARADAATVAAAFDRFGVSEIIIKPQVSGGSYLTSRARPGDAVEPLDDAILQPFVPAILGEGELSFLFIDGTLSHAVRKVAAPGDFRIQPQFGGVFTRFDPEADDVGLAERAIAALPDAPLYARVDLLRLPDGTLALMELEAIEPDLYPHLAPDIPSLLAKAVRARL